MKKSIILWMFFSLILASCAGTKYTSSDYTAAQSNSAKQSAALQDKKQAELENIKTQEVQVLEEYTEYTENYSYFEFDTSVEEIGLSLADNIIEKATDNLGVRYRYGGTTKSGFDCSGLVFTSFKAYDITLPRSSSAMAEYAQNIKDSEAQKGDLIFFITNGGRRINHVGIITEILEDEIKFIHSSTSLGVIISSTKEPYYKKNFVKVARVL